MSQIEELQDAINKLIGSDGDLPGLDQESVADNMVEQQYGEDLKQIKDPEERKKKRKEMVDYLLNQGKAFIQAAISEIKAAWAAIKTIVVTVKEAIVAVTASNAIPPAITTPPGAPNPAYVVIENKQKKNTILSILSQAATIAVFLLKAAVSILFVIPAVVLSTISLLADLKKTAEAIPV